MTSVEIEKAVARLYNPRVCIIVPRVSWGLYLSHECDLLVLNKNNYATEVEIKTSIADLKADLKKKHSHGGGKVIKYLYFAIPQDLLEKAEPIIAENWPAAGIIVKRSDYGLPRFHKRAKANKRAEQWSDTNKMALLRNLQIKFWSNYKPDYEL